MQPVAYNTDIEVAEGWERSAARLTTLLPAGERGAHYGRMMLRCLRMGSKYEPLVLIGGQPVPASQAVQFRYLRAVGMGVQMAAFVFRNIMDMWPPDVPRDTVQLLSRQQLTDTFGQTFGPMLADSLPPDGAQPVLHQFVTRSFDTPIRRRYELASVAWDGTVLGVEDKVTSATAHAAERLVQEHAGYTLITNQRFSPEHEFYAAVVQTGQALWEALGHLD